MKRSPLAALLAALLLSGLVVSTAALGGRTAVSQAVVKVAFNKKLKKSILVDSRGFTLYVYAGDVHGKSACYTYCSKGWPPLRTKGAPHAGQGVKQSLLGVAKRTDGGVQVTYNRHPLYTDVGSRDLGLAGDKKPGDVNGQNFGASWFAVSPQGTPIGTSRKF
jgi:predicted lipoprotein with Yx(FWY)xxD motif